MSNRPTKLPWRTQERQVPISALDTTRFHPTALYTTPSNHRRCLFYTVNVYSCWIKVSTSSKLCNLCFIWSSNHSALIIKPLYTFTCFLFGPLYNTIISRSLIFFSPHKQVPVFNNKLLPQTMPSRFFLFASNCRSKIRWLWNPMAVGSRVLSVIDLPWFGDVSL
jgi:hypothetical protein